jgi:hypothetical protein
MPGFHAVTREGSTSPGGAPHASPQLPASLPPDELAPPELPPDEPPPDEPPLEPDDPPLDAEPDELPDDASSPPVPLDDELPELHAASKRVQLTTTSATGIALDARTRCPFEYVISAVYTPSTLEVRQRHALHRASGVRAWKIAVVHC